MAVVGAYVHVDVQSADAVRRELSAIEGVSTFKLDEPGKVGLVIEAADLDEAHAILKNDVQGCEGVLGAWPVYAHFEPDEAEPDEAEASKAVCPVIPDA